MKGMILLQRAKLNYPIAGFDNFSNRRVHNKMAMSEGM